jgi:hypothetical protein
VCGTEDEGQRYVVKMSSSRFALLLQHGKG